MTARRSERTRLESMLSDLLGDVRELSPLPSGTGGSSYRVECESGTYVAKLFAPGNHVLLGPGDQYALLGPLAAAGIAPERIACDEAAGLLVTRFVADAAAVDSLELRDPARIASVAGLLRRLHRTQVSVPRFAPVRYAERYVARLGGIEHLTPADRGRYRELAGIAQRLDFDAACLCHNDLTADNLLLGAAPRLIDFDYAVIAPACLDLASLVVMNGFSAHDEAVLLAAYYEGGECPFSAAEFARVQRLVRLLAHFWALASTDADAAALVDDRIAEHRIAPDKVAKYRIDNE